MPETTKQTTAGFFPRLCAFVLDRLIVGLLLLPVRIPLWVSAFSGGEVYTRAVLFHYTLPQLIPALGCALYFVLFTILWDATPGKKAMGLRLVSADGSALRPLTLILRETVGRYLSGLLCIGYLLMLGDKENRTLHDRIFDTRVVYALRNQEKKPPLRILDISNKEKDWYKPYKV